MARQQVFQVSPELKRAVAEGTFDGMVVVISGRLRSSQTALAQNFIGGVAQALTNRGLPVTGFFGQETLPTGGMMAKVKVDFTDAEAIVSLHSKNASIYRGALFMTLPISSKALG